MIENHGPAGDENQIISIDAKMNKSKGLVQDDSNIMNFSQPKASRKNDRRKSTAAIVYGQI